MSPKLVKCTFTGGKSTLQGVVVYVKLNNEQQWLHFYLLLFQLSGVATYKDGRIAEKKIDLRIKVVDENDNSPVFPDVEPVEVDELSPKGQWCESHSNL